MPANIVPGLGTHDLSVMIDFLLFGATLAGVAIFHRHTLTAAIIGLGAITFKKLLGTGFNEGAGFQGLLGHFAHEWVLLANLFLLLVGFALLARHFEASRVPDCLPAVLPDNWTGGFVLLTFVFCLSSFLDNIAGALIGATVASHAFKGRVRVGYLAAIVAAANAGGAGSVIGDTTTTTLWLAVRPPGSDMKKISPEGTFSLFPHLGIAFGGIALQSIVYRSAALYELHMSALSRALRISLRFRERARPGRLAPPNSAAPGGGPHPSAGVLSSAEAR